MPLYCCLPANHLFLWTKSPFYWLTYFYWLTEIKEVSFCPIRWTEQWNSSWSDSTTSTQQTVTVRWRAKVMLSNQSCTCWWTADLSSSNSVSAQNQQQVDQKLSSEVEFLVDNERVDVQEKRWKCGAERNVFLFLVVCCPSPLVVALGSRSHSFSLLIWHWNSTCRFLRTDSTGF